MASSVVITIKSELPQADLQRLLELPVSQPKEGILALSKHLRDYATGSKRGSVVVQTASVAPVAASVTATLVSVPVNDTIVLAGTTLTAVASPSTEAQFSQAGTDAQDAASLAACVNAHSVLKLILKASAVGNVVTISTLQAGLLGNQVTSTRTGTAITLSATKLAGGTGGAADVGRVYSAGIV